MAYSNAQISLIGIMASMPCPCHDPMKLRTNPALKMCPVSDEAGLPVIRLSSCLKYCPPTQEVVTPVFPMVLSEHQLAYAPL